MKTVMNMVRALSRGMHIISGILLIVMMVTVLVDIVTRYVFGTTSGAVDFTFRGAVEIVSYGLLFMVLFSLPFSVNRGQVIVDLFTENMSERLKGLLSGLYIFGFGLLGVGMTYRFYQSIGRVAQSGETTQDLIIPLSYIYAITTFATAVLALRGILVSYRLISDNLRAS